MAIIKCKMCGGDIELSADKTFGTCDSCGSTMTFPKVDNEQRAAAFNRGNHFRRIGEFDKALAVYERIVQEDDTDAEAHWCCALCRFGIEYVEDPITYEWLPTCHRASFDSFLEDVDYLAAVEHSDGITRRQYQKDALKIAEVQKGILATSQSEEPFDVFICYKESDENGERTRDSAMAQDIYYQLTEQGRRVFFARITLEDKAGAQYEPYIFAALHSARVMVVVGTKPEHFSAVWVKNEWSRFLALMRRDRTKLLLPCYRDMDPYDLPEQLSVLQSYDMSKIGFIQDLTRGIAKVLDAEEDASPVKETIVVQTQGNANLMALVKRGNMALEDGEWENAAEYFDRALDLDAERAEAYVGRYLVEKRTSSLEKLIKKYLNDTKEPVLETLEAVAENTARIQAAAERYALDGYLPKEDVKQEYHFDRSYQSALKHCEDHYKKEKRAFDADKNMSKALRFAKDDYKAWLDNLRKEYLGELEARVKRARAEDEANITRITAAYEARLNSADLKAAEMHRLAGEQRERKYQETCQLFEKADSFCDYGDVRDAFREMGDYADCAERANQCQEKMQEFQRAKRVAEGKQNRRLKITRALIGVTVLIVIAAILTVNMIIIPSNHYKAGEVLLADGDYPGAIAELEAAGYYWGARQKIFSVYYSYGENLLESGSKAAAAMAFGKAKNYQDAQARSTELWNDIAERKTVDVGYYHTVGLRSDGTVVAVGDHDDDQCDVTDWKGIIAVSAGAKHTVGLKADGTVVAVGRNQHGQCNVSDWKDIVAISAGDDRTVGLKKDGTVVAVGRNNYGQCNVSAWRNIVAVSATGSYTVGVKADGTAVAAGNCSSGQGDVSGWTDIAAVATGHDNALGLKADGTVVATGFSYYGQSAISNWTDTVAISVGGSHIVGLRSDGTLMVVGGNEHGQCDVSDWTDIVAVSAGSYHTVGLKSDGTVVAVGYNKNGQCDVSNWTDIRVP